jgi:ribosomal protein S18 acetylase RimI-like enzyme
MSAARYSVAPDGRPLTEVYMERAVDGKLANAIEVRKATLTDAPSIAVVHVVSERAAYRGLLPDAILDSLSEREQEIAWRARLETGHSTTLVGGKEADVWGWINFGESRDPDAAPRTGEIRAMYVTPDKWRRGVGTALWEEATRSFPQAEYGDVTLWVYARNQLARRFYEKIGFRLEGDVEKNVDRGGKSFSAVRYRCTIQDS